MNPFRLLEARFKKTQLAIFKPASSLAFLVLVLAGCGEHEAPVVENAPLDAQVSGAAAAWQTNQTVFEKMPFEQIKARADKGDVPAELQLGLNYHNGAGVPADQVESARWLRKAADQGNLVGQIFLAEYYFTGTGVKKDGAQAMAWSEKVLSNPDATPWCGFFAGQSLPSAQLFLGDCYALGHHLDQDQAEAAKWYRQAAEKGNAEAQFRIGLCYSFGWGVESNAEDALDWFQQAADQGHPEAQSLLGGAYASGDNVTNDVAEACKWLSLAVAGEWRPDARDRYQKMLDFVKSRMKPEELAEAQRRVAEFAPR